ncbi:hypothetical protein D082_41040 (plasmid) [Synechocystis sp. PCC 6714]|nr:hypothetical protein D082_41040 [Synechocystis sp. PCC 6714]
MWFQGRVDNSDVSLGDRRFLPNCDNAIPVFKIRIKLANPC